MIAANSLLDAQRVALAFAHFGPVNRDQVVEQPVAGKLATVGRFALSHLALVVRKDIFQAAAVNIEGQTQIFAGHDRTLGVPAGETCPPRAAPLHQMIGLGRPPDGKITRVALVCRHFQPRPLFQFIYLAPRKLTIRRPAWHRKINIAVGFVSVTLFNQKLSQFNLFRHMAAGAG